MKKLNAGLVVAFMAFVCGTSYAQSNAEREGAKPITSSPETIKPNYGNDDWILADYQKQVDDIQKKIDWVKANPEEHKKALTSGWYDQAKESLRVAEAERDAYAKKHDHDGLPSQNDPDYDKKKAEWIKNNPEKYEEMTKQKK